MSCKMILPAALVFSAELLFAAPGRAAAQCPPGILRGALESPTATLLTDNDQFGVSVAVSGGLAVVGAHLDDPGDVTDTGAAYVFDADPASPTFGAVLATLSNPDPTASDFFGISVAISGTFAVVGAHGDDPGAVSAAGTAYVFDATTSALLTTLNNPAPGTGDNFGFSVAIDGNLAVVGAWLDDPGAVSNAGTAYVFDATTGALIATLDNPAATGDDNFGGAVAISGSVVVVGAPLDDAGAANRGRAYLFDATSGELGFTLNLPVGAGGNENFGRSVAIDGNIVVVGQPLGFVGQAFGFDATTGAHTATYFDAPTHSPGSLLGGAVAISGNTVIVGARNRTSGIPSVNAGEAYAYDATTGALLETLQNPAPADGDEFGGAVAVSGNVAVVGARLDESTIQFTANVGNAFVYFCEPPAPTPTPTPPGPTPTPSPVPTIACIPDTFHVTLDNPAPAEGDLFGSSVAVSGNLAVVGAYSDDSGFEFDNGSAHVFDLTTGAIVSALAPPAPQTNARFGGSVAIDGILAVVGEHLYSPGAGAVTGRAYVFDATTGARISTLYHPDARDGDGFGFSVAISGNLAVVGALFADPGSPGPGVFNAGVAYVFHATTGALVTTLNNPAPVANAAFGGNVALSGNLALVGGFVGVAYVFDATTGALVSTLSNPSPGELFVESLAISGNVAVVGNNGIFHPVDPTPGRAYIFNATTAALMHTLNTPSPPANGDLGSPFAVSGNIVVVGEGETLRLYDATNAALLATITTSHSSVAISGGVVVSAAPFADPGGVTNAGEAHVFICDGPAPTATPSATVSPTPTSTPTPTATPTPVCGAFPYYTGFESGSFGPEWTITGTNNFRTMVTTQFGPFAGTHHAGMDSSPSGAPESRNELTLCVDLAGRSNVTLEFAARNFGETNKPVPPIPFTGSADFNGVAISQDGNTWYHVFDLNVAAIGSAYGVRTVDLDAAVATHGLSYGQHFRIRFNRTGLSILNMRGIVIDEVKVYDPNPATPTPSPIPCCPGDADNSGSFVDANDFIAVQANFGADNGVGGPGDANCSGSFVDANDFIAVQANFGADCG